MYKKVWPFGFVYDNKKWRRTAWSFSVGLKRKCYYGGAKQPINKYDFPRRKVITTGIRIVEWPWMKDLKLQFYFRGNIIFTLDKYTWKNR